MPRQDIPLRHDGLQRPYILQTPVDAGAAGEPLPLVVQLHGRGIPAVLFDGWTGFGELADRAGFALALPQAIDEIWNDGRYGAGPDDIGYLLAVIADAAERVPVDGRRVYLVGMSNGAAMVGRLALEQGGRFAAVAQVAGTASLDLATSIRPMSPVPLLQIHGTADRSMPYGGGVAKGILMQLLLARRRRASPAIGVDAWAALWVRVNGALEPAKIERLGEDTSIRRWSGASPAADVAFYRVERGGHTWPGNRQWSPPFLGRSTRSFDATSVIWEFLRSHTRST